MADSELDRLLGYSKRFGDRQIRLSQVLGGGATAVVFRGIDANHPDDRSLDVAVKVARVGASWQQALENEWHNLCKLEEAEQARGSHYFPRIPDTNKEQDLQQDFYPAGKRVTVYVLIQELVPGNGVHDLLLAHPGLRLTEPLALEIAQQYAEMLTILHAAELTCADRKLADLRWQQNKNFQNADFTPGDRETLNRWSQQSPGHLMVLDWNVTEKASDETKALDLFRFGILWHRMLLGVEPRFRRGENWQLEAPLARHPIWPQLSFGARQILSQLLHSVPERRYTDSSNLLQDIKDQIKLWQANVPTLEGEFNETYQHYIEHPDQRDQEAVEKALAAADVLRVRIAQWGERQPTDFQRIHDSLQQAAAEAPFYRLKDTLEKSRWDEALSEIEKLLAEQHDPARLLHLDRQRHIVVLMNETPRTQEQVERLFEQSKLIFDYDRQKEKLSDDHINRWKSEAEIEQDDSWKRIKNRLWQEAGYRLALEQARQFREQGKFLGALKTLKFVNPWRKELSSHGPEIITRLDQLYGNPVLAQKELEAIVAAHQNRADALSRGLESLSSFVELETAMQNLATVLLAEPGNAILAQAYRLLEAAQSYHRARQAQCLALEIAFLEQLFAAHAKLAEAANCSPDEPLKQEWARIDPQIKSYLDTKRDDLRERVLSDIGIYTATNTLPFERPPEKATTLLVQRYLEVEAFHDDRFKQTLKERLKQHLPGNREDIASIVQAIEKHQAHWVELETILGNYFTAP